MVKLSRYENGPAPGKSLGSVVHNKRFRRGLSGLTAVLSYLFPIEFNCAGGWGSVLSCKELADGVNKMEVSAHGRCSLGSLGSSSYLW